MAGCAIIEQRRGVAPPFWIMMYYVYILQSQKSDFIYIGSTPDLKKRFYEHNNSRSKATKPHAPFKLVYYEAYADKRDALGREYKLKHHGSVIGHLKKRLLYSSQKGGA
jgi:putative endonuclease